MSITISTSFYEKLDPKKVDKAIEPAVKEVLMTLKKGCLRASPYDTGKLYKSHFDETEKGDFVCTGLLKNSAEYWSYVEFGTSKMLPRKWVAGTMRSTDSFGIFNRSFRARYKK